MPAFDLLVVGDARFQGGTTATTPRGFARSDSIPKKCSADSA